MDLEQITSEIYNRVMEKMNQNQSSEKDTQKKKFLQSGRETMAISGYEPAFLDDIKEQKEVLEYGFMVISSLTIDEMTASANGIATNEKTQALRHFLLNGKPVYIIEEGLEYRHYKTISNPVYFNLFREYENKLLQYGVRIMSKVALESVLVAKEKPVSTIIEIEESVREIRPIGNDDAALKPEYSTEAKLITHELAIQLATKSPLVFKLGTLITPYAKDVFRENRTIVTIK